LSRYVGRTNIGASRGRKIPSQPTRIDLEHAHLLQRIVERVCSEKPKGVPAVPLGRDHFRRSGRQEDLPAVRKRQQAGSTVQGRAEVVGVAAFRGADVKRHANGKAAYRRPVARSKRLLCGYSSVHRVGRQIECGVETVARGLEDAAAAFGDGVVQDSIVLAQRFLHRRAMVEPAQAGSFDVGEQERYDVGGAVSARG